MKQQTQYIIIKECNIEQQVLKINNIAQHDIMLSYNIEQYNTSYNNAIQYNKSQHSIDYIV